jgi:hypothetical protein
MISTILEAFRDMSDLQRAMRRRLMALGTHPTGP